mmetsp:Transcript_58984/g.86330  ORF Transcript_58984/g.86330 Transcript_58984/m.86330 type:complete len:134 (+) Transcript_58984:135-536(+)
MKPTSIPLGLLFFLLNGTVAFNLSPEGLGRRDFGRQVIGTTTGILAGGGMINIQAAIAADEKKEVSEKSNSGLAQLPPKGSVDDNSAVGGTASSPQNEKDGRQGEEEDPFADRRKKSKKKPGYCEVRGHRCGY